MAMSNKAYRDMFSLTELSQVGQKKRINDTSNFHPMVRSDWGTQDSLRGVLGGYRTTYYGSKGVQLYNYAVALEQLSAGNSVGAYDRGKGGLKKLRKQLQGSNDGTNIIFDYEVVSQPTGPSIQAAPDWQPSGPLAQARPDCLDQTQIDQIIDMGGSVPDGRGCPGTTHAPAISVEALNTPASAEALNTPEHHGAYQEFLKLTYGIQEQGAWNGYSARSNASTDFLSNVSSMTSFLSGTYNIGNTLYNGVLNDILETPLTDHSLVLYAVPANPAVRRQAGYNLHLDPVYNYYASTTPPYEVVIGLPGTGRASPTAISIKEYHLPNVYYLQSELNNTSSTLLAQYHLPSLTLDQNIPWFNIGNQQNVTEANVDRYYDLYAEGITALKSDSDLYGAVDATLNFNNRNFVVLHSDLDAIKEDRINTTTIPFYNKLTLGYDADIRTGHSASVSILRNLYNNPDTRDFINILQMQTVLRLTTEKDLGATLPMMQTHKQVLSSEDPSNFTNQTAVADVNVLYDLEDLFEEYLTTNREIEIASIINNFATFDPDVQYIGMDLEQLPFRLIRDYNMAPDQLDADPIQVENAYVEMYEDKNSLSNVGRVTRSYKEMLRGTQSHTETLMYVVNKKRAPDGPPVQTFYISAEFANDNPSVYFDTQVKYETDYYYDIARVVLVFGNEYEYDEVSSVTGGTNILGLPITSKIKLNNSPSVKALLIPYLANSAGLPAKIMDKPPVPPEITFYPFKGINNRLKILLNSSTGKINAAPIAIEESDEEFFLGEYHSQTGNWEVTYGDMISSGSQVSFRSDDPVDAYEVFKLDRKPESYQSFAGNSVFINPVRGVPGDILDVVTPNTKYYYCARAIDIHGNLSNPTYIYEIEIVDNNGQIFLKQDVIRYEAPKPDFVKPARRFVYIEPAFRQIIFPDGTVTGPPSVDTPPLSSILGDTGVDKVWGKTFKVRVKSKQTGRKVDLNLTFKNTGIVNASE